MMRLTVNMLLERECWFKKLFCQHSSCWERTSASAGILPNANAPLVRWSMAWLRISTATPTPPNTCAHTYKYTYVHFSKNLSFADVHIFSALVLLVVHAQLVIMSFSKFIDRTGLSDNFSLLKNICIKFTHKSSSVSYLIYICISNKA